MAFVQIGFGTKLTWEHFGKARPGDAPGPGATATAAFTSVSHSYSIGPPTAVKNSKPTKFQPSTNVTLTTSFKKADSFVMAWAKKRPSNTDLLHHEQLHFDIAALVGRDALAAAASFVASKPSFFTAEEATEALKSEIDTVLSQGQTLQDAYDEAVHPEQDQGITKGPEQIRWDGFVKAAKTELRDPSEKWPDGSAMKTTIFDAAVWFDAGN